MILKSKKQFSFQISDFLLKSFFSDGKNALPSKTYRAYIFLRDFRAFSKSTKIIRFFNSLPSEIIRFFNRLALRNQHENFPNLVYRVCLMSNQISTPERRGPSDLEEVFSFETCASFKKKIIKSCFL